MMWFKESLSLLPRPHSNLRSQKSTRLDDLIFQDFKRIQKTKDGCTPIQYSTVQYSTVQYSTVQSNPMQRNATQYNAIRSNAMRYNPMQCNTMQCNAMQSKTIQYNTIQVYCVILLASGVALHEMPHQLVYRYST